MKKFTLVFIGIFLFSGISFANKKKAEKEKAAIIKVIEDGTKAFRARDIKIMDTYVKDENTVRLGVSKNGFGVARGYSHLESGYKNNFKNNPNQITAKYEKVNYQVKVFKESAWAIHDQINHQSDGNKNKQIIVHFLEKVHGNWKISYISVLNASSFE